MKKIFLLLFVLSFCCCFAQDTIIVKSFVSAGDTVTIYNVEFRTIISGKDFKTVRSYGIPNTLNSQEVLLEYFDDWKSLFIEGQGSGAGFYRKYSPAETDSTHYRNYIAKYEALKKEYYELMDELKRYEGRLQMLEVFIREEELKFKNDLQNLKQ